MHHSAQIMDTPKELYKPLVEIMRERRVETETETEKEKEVVNVQERGQDQGTKIVAVTAKATRREEVEAGE